MIIKHLITPAIILIAVSTVGLCFIKPVYVNAQPSTSVTCPCNYSAIPKTAACWLDPFHGNPVTTEFETTKCFLENYYTGLPTQFPQPVVHAYLGVEKVPSGTDWVCSVVISAIDSPPLTGCGQETEYMETLSAQELSACKAELQEYLTALNEVQGISVPGGPPYTCPDGDSLAPPPTPIPAISEWGLLAIAAVLGVVGIVIMIRRKVID